MWVGSEGESGKEVGYTALIMESQRVAYLRNFVFGVEDSLVSTVGLLSGIAIAGLGTKEIFLAGLILIFVEAVSMSAGSFLSESSAKELATGKSGASRQNYFASAIMFVSYFVSGFIPLTPYLLCPVAGAFWFSIGAALVALFVLGVVSATLSKTKRAEAGVRMVVIGGVAIGVGVLIGNVVGPHLL